MLNQGSVSDLISERVTRDKAYVVITMRRYPRFIGRQYRDEYISCLSPTAKLLEDFLTKKRATGNHNSAFNRAGFERRFMPNEEELTELERLSKLSRERDVVLICQCQVGNRCHREMTLLLARELYRAKIGKIYHDYPIFLERVKEIRKALKGPHKRTKAAAEAIAAKDKDVATKRKEKRSSPSPPTPDLDRRL